MSRAEFVTVEVSMIQLGWKQYDGGMTAGVELCIVGS